MILYTGNRQFAHWTPWSTTLTAGADPCPWQITKRFGCRGISTYCTPHADSQGIWFLTSIPMLLHACDLSHGWNSTDNLVWLPGITMLMVGDESTQILIILLIPATVSLMQFHISFSILGRCSSQWCHDVPLMPIPKLRSQCSGHDGAVWPGK